jgi:hypothetical protein
MDKVVGIEYGFNDNDGKEDGSLSFEESFSILDEDHDEEDFNEEQYRWKNQENNSIDKMQYGLVPEFRSSLPEVLSALLIVQSGVNLTARKYILLSVVDKAVAVNYQEKD